jgi:hypothetical protein
VKARGQSDAGFPITKRQITPRQCGPGNKEKAPRKNNDGDQIFEQCDSAPNAPMKCKLTGGTGKFNGLQADVDITAAPLNSNYEGVAQLMGQRKGTYKIIKTN